MNTCSRCGVGVRWDPQAHAWMSINSDRPDFCPATASGQASVHRVEGVKDPTTRRQSGPFWKNPVVQAVGGWYAGKLAGELLFGGSQAKVPQAPTSTGNQQIDNAVNFFRSR